MAKKTDDKPGTLTRDNVLDAAENAANAAESKPLTQNQKASIALAKLSEFGDAAKAAISKAMKAKPEEFKAEEQSFWKPENPGDVLQGIYLGHVVKNRYKVHAMGTLDNHGEPLAIHFNGSHVLSSELARRAPGTGCKITYLGKKGVEDTTHSVNLFKVEWLG